LFSEEQYATENKINIINIFFISSLNYVIQ
jgi:hypothetical protein